MSIDSVLHIIVGGILTLMMFSLKVRGIFILISLIFLSVSKEVYDHFYTLGHCYPDCLEEHVVDFLFSLLFFFLYIPFLSLTRKTSPKLSFGQFVVFGFFIILAQLGYSQYTNQKKNSTFRVGHFYCRK